jgi:hypothetical protein
VQTFLLIYVCIAAFAAALLITCGLASHRRKAAAAPNAMAATQPHETTRELGL